MDQEDKILNPEESLRVIRETIELAKLNLRENGFHFLLWGWLVVLACLAEYYIRVVLGSPWYGLAWMAMIAVGVPTAVIYSARHWRKQLVPRNIVRSWYGTVWIGFGVSVFLGLVLSIREGESPIPLILILAGMATFISGAILRFSALRFGAVALWLGAVVCFFVLPEAHVLVEAAAMVVGYLIPGHLLNAQFRTRHV